MSDRAIAILETEMEQFHRRRYRKFLQSNKYEGIEVRDRQIKQLEKKVKQLEREAESLQDTTLFHKAPYQSRSTRQNIRFAVNTVQQSGDQIGSDKISRQTSSSSPVLDMDLPVLSRPMDTFGIG